MPSPSPRVTVGMAVYGGEAHIAAAIRSVLAQDYEDWELLLINDCSPDNSVSIIETFEDRRIRLLHNEANQGLVAVRNRILHEAHGEFVAWLDQDDLAAPRRLSTQVAYLDTHAEISACGSITKMLLHTDGHSESMATSLLPLRHRDIRAALPFINPMACNTVTMRIVDFQEAGLSFRSAFGNSLDYDLWSLASDELLLANLPEPLGTYRIHAGQTSQGAALAVMNTHAMRVRSELIGRSLGIAMSDEQEFLHRSATIAPVDVADVDRVRAIAEWFALLRRTNSAERAFDQRSFDEALTRQWITVVRAARSTIGPGRAARALLEGGVAIGPRFSAAATSVLRGAQRRAAK